MIQPDYKQCELKVREIMLSQNAVTIEQKVLVLRDIFHLLSPLGLDKFALMTVVNSGKSLGLLSDSSYLLSNYRTFLVESVSKD